jgi:acetyl-CoA acetyltransferase
MTTQPLVAGVGMTKFQKPGQSDAWDALGVQAARLALADAGIDYADVRQAFVGFVYANTTSGQTTLYQLGMTGIPIVNVNNACASGSTALYMARQAVESGAVEVALAVGFEQMAPGALTLPFNTPPAVDTLAQIRRELQPIDPSSPYAAQLFGGAGREHQQRHGTAAATFAQIQVKARRHAANNPLALFNAPLTLEEVMASPHLYGPLTRYQACAPTCGGAAAIIVSREFARRRGLSRLVEIAGQAMTSDTSVMLEEPSMLNVVGYDMTRRAARQVYEQTGVGPQDVQVVELHDCFTVAEAVFAEGLQLCPEGEVERLVLEGDMTYGGKYVVNPSGGLLSKGHPLGATGLAQCYELVKQVRGEAERRQVPGVEHALQHNAGLIGTCVVTLYRRAPLA